MRKNFYFLILFILIFAAATLAQNKEQPPTRRITIVEAETRGTPLPPLPPPPPSRDYFPDKWKEFQFAEFGFKIRSPKEPTTVLETVGLGGDVANLTNFESGAASFIKYLVSVKELKKLPASAGEAQTIFKRELDARLGGDKTKAVLIKERDDKFGEFPAKYFEIERDGRRLRALNVLRGKFLYTISVSSVSTHGAAAMKAANAYGEIADAFIASFALLGEPTLFSDVKSVDENLDEAWQNFVSAEDGFAVDLPGAPVKTVSQVDVETRRLSRSLYTVKTNRLRYSIVVMDYKLPLTDAAVLKNLFDIWRNGYAENFQGKLTAEKDFDAGDGRVGREIVLENGAVRILGRAFFVNGRFYAATLISDSGFQSMLAEQKIIDAAAHRVFGSLKPQPTKNQQQADEADAALPDGFFGRFAENKYVNDFFKFSLDAPTRWIFVESIDARIFVELGRDAIVKRSPEYVKKLNAPERMLFMLNKKPLGAPGNASLVVASVKQTSANIDLKLTMQVSEKFFGKQPDSRITKPTSVYKIGRREVAYFERELTAGGKSADGESKSEPIKQSIHAVLHKNYMLMFITTYTNDADAATMKAAIASLRFK